MTPIPTALANGVRCHSGLRSQSDISRFVLNKTLLLDHLNLIFGVLFTDIAELRISPCSVFPEKKKRLGVLEAISYYICRVVARMHRLNLTQTDVS